MPPGALREGWLPALPLTTSPVRVAPRERSLPRRANSEAQEASYKDILDPHEAPPAPTVFAARRKRTAWQAFTSRLAGALTGGRRRDHASGGSFNEAPDGHDYRVGSAPAGPTIPALVHLPTSQTYSFAAACQQAWKETDDKDANKVLIFKGLRVRMAVHAGVTNPECIVEKAKVRSHAYAASAALLPPALRTSAALRRRAGHVRRARRTTRRAASSTWASRCSWRRPSRRRRAAA